MKKTHQEKFNDMLNEGFSEKTLSKMSEAQLSGLHKRIVSEQTSGTGKVMMKASKANPAEIKKLSGQGINIELTEKKNQKKSDRFFRRKN